MADAVASVDVMGADFMEQINELTSSYEIDFAVNHAIEEPRVED